MGTRWHRTPPSLTCPTLGDPYDMLAMATVDGAKCLGLETVAGSLTPGLRADFVAVDLRRSHFTPLLAGKWSNIAAHLVFAATGADVSAVWVDGLQLVAHGQLLTADLNEIRSDAQAAAEELFERRERLRAPAGV
jgi:5-methylthioadenosine/S-adenosylhomocysteine deaminase